MLLTKSDLTNFPWGKYFFRTFASNLSIMTSYKFILNLYHKPGRGLFSCLIS
jgi:hypothetical protein